MGFSVYYRSTRPVSETLADAVRRSASHLARCRSWLGSEPVGFHPTGEDEHLFGSSKPNFFPHPYDAADASRSGLPDGTTRDVLDILCQLSREHAVDWEISHDHSYGPIGHVRDGTCDDDVLQQIECFSELGGILDEVMNDLPDLDEVRDDGDDDPPILKFPTKGT